ncbi:response regulator [Gracilibacillus alcaliphilus]|uniref:response regulator n=1 Tax=Gracilibacillus alcaliphilus TaxID=1401441 RepID=UPI001956B6DC|nr:response regulator [Gracilibacillus alcaliphilus]MBM7677674.1 two-component system response regulator YesN [Gracilibacillus alcaliphilus]
MRKLIIVDDNVKTSEGIRAHIGWDQLNLEVIGIFTSAYEALEFLTRHSIDIIITDINMPAMNGIQLTKEIIKQQPLVKVIFISAHDDFMYAQEAIRLDVFDYIEKPIDFSYLAEKLKQMIEMIEEEQAILYQLNESKPLLMEKFFTDLIDSNPQYASYNLLEQAEFLGIDIDKKSYVSIVIDIKNFKNLINKYTVEQCHIALIQLRNALINRLSSNSLIYYCNQTDELIFIIGSDHINLKQYSQTIAAFYAENASILEYKVGIGNIVSQIWDISMSYQRAKQALEHQFIFPESTIFDANQLKNQASNPILFTYEDEEKLVTLISANDVEGMSKFIKQLEKTWINESLPRSLISAHIYRLISRLIKFTHDINLSDKDWHYEASVFFVESNHVTSIKQLSEHFFLLCKKLCSVFNESIADRTEIIAEETKRYIHNHYMDSDLGLEVIAEQVNLNASYLGSLFKRATHTNILKYITKVRMEKAEELLKNKQLKVKDISEMIGYSNQYYFSASFKKYYGKTPTEFREELGR